MSHVFRSLTAVSALVLVSGIASFAHGSPFSWQRVAVNLNHHLETAVLLYKQGHVLKAKRAVTKAYFVGFEASRFEPAERMVMTVTHITAMENQFRRLRTIITHRLPPPSLAAVVTSLQQGLESDARKLDASNVPQRVYRVQS